MLQSGGNHPVTVLGISTWPTYLAEHGLLEDWTPSEDGEDGSEQPSEYSPPTQVAKRLASLLPVLLASQIQPESVDQRAVIQEVWSDAQDPDRIGAAQHAVRLALGQEVEMLTQPDTGNAGTVSLSRAADEAYTAAVQGAHHSRATSAPSHASV